MLSNIQKTILFRYPLKYFWYKVCLSFYQTVEFFVLNSSLGHGELYVQPHENFLLSVRVKILIERHADGLFEGKVQ